MLACCDSVFFPVPFSDLTLSQADLTQCSFQHILRYTLLGLLQQGTCIDWDFPVETGVVWTVGLQVAGARVSHDLVVSWLLHCTQLWLWLDFAAQFWGSSA